MKNLLLPFLLFVPLLSSAQELFWYQNKDETVEFVVSQDEYFVSFKKEDKTIVQNKAIKFTALSETTAVILTEKDTRSFEERKATIAKQFNDQVNGVEPVLVYEDGTRQLSNGLLTLKLRDAVTLDKLLGDWKYEFVTDEFVENQYIISIEGISTHQLFALVSELNHNKNIDFAEPDFTRFLKPHTTDPFYSSQWAISNQGYLGGTVDADMDVDGAWAYATGQGIKVAIIDEGVDLTHNDLTSNLLSGYDATGSNSQGAPNEANNDSHGTNCAGIVASVANNNTGTAGIAYNAKVIPVRIAYTNGYPLGDNRRAWITSDSWIANGINWAVNNGADVLSCSWGGGSSSSAINNAIDNAV
ncbi:MAG: S8 family serine peptidase, partial [Cyclobacteriaceae bacterium]|nr:S8 family serine peptidase [Cyclobacteriaceae bacterium]